VSHDGHPAPLPGRVGLGEAIRRYPLALAIPLVVLGIGGAAVGLGKTTSYTATAQVVINQPLALNAAAALPGEVEAAQALAANDSRLIRAQEVVDPLAAEFHTSTGEIALSLSATPIPNSALIRIEAEADSAAGAVRLANAAAAQFSAYVTKQLQTDTEAERMLALYKRAALAYAHAVGAQRGVEKQVNASAETVAHASAAVAAAQLREQALSAQYQSLVQSHATAPTISPFLLSVGAVSDRRSHLEIYALAGVFAGAVIGAALAVALANRRSAAMRPA